MTPSLLIVALALLSFVAFPDDKPFSGWFLGGILTFIAAIGLELKSRIEKKRR